MTNDIIKNKDFRRSRAEDIEFVRRANAINARLKIAVKNGDDNWIGIYQKASCILYGIPLRAWKASRS